MNRTYPLRRLTPEAAGKLEHDHARALAKLARLEAELAELERQVRAQFGQAAFLQLRNNARNAMRIAQLKQELAA